MAEEHWFDTLHKLLTQDAPRRSVLSALALTFGQCLGATDAAAGSGGNRRKNKGKKTSKRRAKKNRNGTGDSAEPTPNPPPSCSGGACAQHWAGNQSEINYCEFICRQCDEDDPREFCIGVNSNAAICCNLPAPHCCNGSCTNRQDDRNNCGTCGNACSPGEFCSDGTCVPICQSRNCPQGQLCYNGNRQFCSGQASSDCTCGCGGLNYCWQAQGYWACQSNPC